MGQCEAPGYSDASDEYQVPPHGQGYHGKGGGASSPSEGVAAGKGRGKGKGGGGGGHGKGAWDEARKARVAVAQENYNLRHNWPIPTTLYVTPRECQRLDPRQLSNGEFNKGPRVSFSSWTTADAVLQLAARRKLDAGSICLLNYANGTPEHVGGGYKTGALAQEEDLCRRMPNLYTSLLQAKNHGMYPFGPSTYDGGQDPARYCDVLYTPDVALARLGEDQGFALMDQRGVRWASVITAAAPNVGFGGEIADPALMKQTLRSIFLAPKGQQPGIRVLIVGAWGCGAFGGDPQQISSMFVEVMVKEGLGNLYDEVHFAIPAGEGNSNAGIFKATLQKAGVKLQVL